MTLVLLKMKRHREGPPTRSLFPHEVRARQIVALLLCFRYAEANQQYAMAQVPRDIVRMICGWVRADFTGLYTDSNGTVWKLIRRDPEIDNWLIQIPLTLQPFIWTYSSKYYSGFYPCPTCLSLRPTTHFNEDWKCQHDYPYDLLGSNLNIPTDSLAELKRKYILPE